MNTWKSLYLPVVLLIQALKWILHTKDIHLSIDIHLNNFITVKRLKILASITFTVKALRRKLCGTGRMIRASQTSFSIHIDTVWLFKTWTVNLSFKDSSISLYEEPNIEGFYSWKWSEVCLPVPGFGEFLCFSTRDWKLSSVYLKDDVPLVSTGRRCSKSCSLAGPASLCTTRSCCMRGAASSSTPTARPRPSPRPPETIPSCLSAASLSPLSDSSLKTVCSSAERPAEWRQNSHTINQMKGLKYIFNYYRSHV